MLKCYSQQPIYGNDPTSLLDKWILKMWYVTHEDFIIFYLMHHFLVITYISLKPWFSQHTFKSFKIISIYLVKLTISRFLFLKFVIKDYNLKHRKSCHLQWCEWPYWTVCKIKAKILIPPNFNTACAKARKGQAHGCRVGEWLPEVMVETANWRGGESGKFDV